MMRISIGILSFAAFSVLAGCAKTQKAGPEPVPVVAEIVATQQVQPSWTYSGEIRPDTEVQLAFKEPGYIAALYRVKGVDGRMRDLQVGDEIPARATLARAQRRVRLMFRKRNSTEQRPTRQRRILILSVHKRSMPPKQ
jgi:hypothetical protein